MTAILSVSGIPVVEYTYDAWGNILSITGSRANNLGKYNPLRYRGYVYDRESSLYYLQSRYYDPTLGRFINADTFATTGQGLLGNNMFAYCNNNPVNFKDDAGTRMEYVSSDCGAPAGFPSPSAVSKVTPPRGSGKRITLPIEFSLAEGTATVKGGTKTASILSGEFDMYSFDDGGLNLISFDASVVSLDLENEKRTLSLFNLGNASASIGLNGLPYASVLVSLWSPSVTFPLFKKQVTITVHMGAVGIGYEYSSEFNATFANGIGASIGVK